MRLLVLLIPTMLALPLVSQGAQSAPSMPSDAAMVAGAASQDALTAFARRGGGGVHVSGGHVGGARVGAGHAATRNMNRNVNRNVGRNVGRVGVGGVVVVRPIRPWVRRPYYGTVIAGVALGTIIAATAVPTAPSSDLCWYWSNSSHIRGY
jgi:hypothetical protein